MGRKPWIALLMCFCSCSLDTSPDLAGAREQDASLPAPKRQQASLRFDAPLQPRKSLSAAVRRARRDDTDAGDAPKDAGRGAGRAASDRPALSPARDAGPMDAGAKQKSTSSHELPATQDSGKPSEHAAIALQRDAGSSSHSSEDSGRSGRRHRDRDQHEARSDGHSHDDDERDGRRKRDDGDDER